ncbi:MAG: carboxyltransferase domain-containing protein [Planctomycetes bacterium]|nr:carboxyltransferase domain-containing protein [Planctomycetota bacterium]
MQLQPLGDQAVMAYCDDDAAATRLALHVRQAMPDWCVDVVQAYVTVAVYYDLAAVDFDAVAVWLANLDTEHRAANAPSGRSHIIPCCYELGLDFDRIEHFSGLAREEIIRLHSGQAYTVFAIGFCPGFPYLGYLHADLAKTPRLESPRLRVDAGSVGLTGRQTGIYTEARPGGWNIVGRTPLLLVDVASEYFPLRTGDQVRFRPIDRDEFDATQGQRLRSDD